MPSRISPDLGDPVRTAWQIAWVGHAMLHDPLHIFDSNAFYPHPLSLAFSDSLLGYGPAAFFGSGTVAALVRYNLLFLWAWSFCFVGAYLLARELGLGRLGGAAAGVAFAYAPYRVTEAGHLHVISSGGTGAGAVPAAARLPALLAQARARRLARLRLADQPRLHARPAVRLPARPARAARARVLVARAPDPGPGVARGARATAVTGSPRRTHRPPRAGRRRIAAAGARTPRARAADPPPAARGHADRRRRARRRHRLSGAPVPAGRRPVSDGPAHDQGSRNLLRRPGRAAGRLLGEPRVGLRSPPACARKSTPRTRACSSPAG